MKKILVPITSLILLTGFDQLTKYLARHFLSASPKVLIDGVFELRLTFNTGAAFGILKGMNWLFYVFAAIVLAAIVYFYKKYSNYPKLKVIRILMIFISSGIIGNLIDRIFIGSVTDFFYISLIDFPIFNVADIYISWSMVLLVILLIFKFKESDFNGPG
ncbi:MAG: signal peptidase II [Lachnospiraceae bacterium]|nr:signal peptidase II [Lachnospiraceae bacterium]